MEEHTESWQLRSGTWNHDAKSGAWRLASTPNGTIVNPKLSSRDVGRMVGARRDRTSGEWLPSDFSYSPQTGRLLDASITTLDSPWVPPFGASALSDFNRPFVKGLRQTPAPLTLARSSPRFDRTKSDTRTLPALPPGQYRFLVHKFDVVSPTLMAIEPERGDFLVLLPESNAWVPLQCPLARPLAEGLKNSRGWRLEVLEGAGAATLYLPTANGLAAVTPTLIGLSYTVEYSGEAIALGGPVAWAGEVWLPLLGRRGVVELLGKPRGAAKPTVLPTTARMPRNGFEAPVSDPLVVNWPSEEGQLIVRMDPRGKPEADWIAWPDGLRPVFSLGSPYLSRSGSFWQLCRRDNESLEYVKMGRADPETAAVDTPRLGTGHVSYKNDQRINADPWIEPDRVAGETSSEVVVPLLESEFERVVVGLRLDAPQGVLALFESDEEQHAVLQLQAENRPPFPFGALTVTRPWLTSLFVYDSHLWVYHPELTQALGWKLDI